MKGDALIIEMLNDALIDELMAINQYILHSEIFSNWGYEKLGAMEKGLARAEMGHAERLIERIVFLEGMPNMTNYRKLNIGEKTPDMLASDLKLEMGAVDRYRKIAETAFSKGDKVTFELASSLLKDEEDHVNTQEGERDMIVDMGLQIYLSTKVEA
jgi:bacterioferritin